MPHSQLSMLESKSKFKAAARAPARSHALMRKSDRLELVVRSDQRALYLQLHYLSQTMPAVTPLCMFLQLVIATVGAVTWRLVYKS